MPESNDAIAERSTDISVTLDNLSEVNLGLISDPISKMVIDEKDTDGQTVPDAVTLGGYQEIGIKRLKPIAIPKWLLSHPAVERGIEFKFNRMIKQLDKDNIAKNIKPADDSKQAKEAAEYCATILKNCSLQPMTWIKQFGRDAMRFGDNYFVLITNKAGSEVKRWELQNPIFFSPGFDKEEGLASNHPFALSLRGEKGTKFHIDPKTKKPSDYTQLKKKVSNITSTGYSSGNLQDPASIEMEPFGKLIPASKVVQLNFDRIGDEPMGIPIGQTIWSVVGHILKVEDAGTQTMINFGYNRWVANTKFRTVEKMKDFGKSIENIAKRSVVILPEGVDLTNIKPGSTEFDKVHNILLSLIAMRLGISRIQLIGESADINKATLNSMMKDIRYDFFADELELESAINDGFVKSCNIKYNIKGKAVETFPYPRFSFYEMEEDEDVKAARLLKESLSIRNFTFSINLLKANGMDKRADILADYFMDTLIGNRSSKSLPTDIPDENVVIDAKISEAKDADSKNSDKKPEDDKSK